MLEDRECPLLFSLTVTLSFHILLDFLRVFFFYDDSIHFYLFILFPHFLPYLYFYIVFFSVIIAKKQCIEGTFPFISLHFLD